MHTTDNQTWKVQKTELWWILSHAAQIPLPWRTLCPSSWASVAGGEPSVRSLFKGCPGCRESSHLSQSTSRDWQMRGHSSSRAHDGVAVALDGPALQKLLPLPYPLVSSPSLRCWSQGHFWVDILYFKRESAFPRTQPSTEFSKTQLPVGQNLPYQRIQVRTELYKE